MGNVSCVLRLWLDRSPATMVLQFLSMLAVDSCDGRRFPVSQLLQESAGVRSYADMQQTCPTSPRLSVWVCA